MRNVRGRGIGSAQAKWTYRRFVLVIVLCASVTAQICVSTSSNAVGAKRVVTRNRASNAASKLGPQQAAADLNLASARLQAQITKEPVLVGGPSPREVDTRFDGYAAGCSVAA